MEPPDRLEKRIRFGCGFLFGLLVAGAITRLLSVFTVNGYYGLAVFVGAGVAFGWLAMRYGDEFWLGLRDLWRWLFS